MTQIAQANHLPERLLRLVRSPIFWVMLLATVWQMGFYSNCVSSFQHPDTLTYLIPSHNPRLLLGDIDQIRTPVYPCFIAAIRYFAGEEKCVHGVVLVQQLISWISVYFFFHTARKLFKSIFVTVGVSLYYACNPAILGFNVSMLTESLAVSGVVFAVFLLCSYLDRPSTSKAIMMGIAIFLLIMLRPIFLLFLPVFLLLWTVRLIVVREQRFRETDLTCLWASLAALILVLGYCQLFKQKYGEFSLSLVPYVNQLHIVVQSGLYRNGSDPITNKKIAALWETWKKENPHDAQPGSPWIYPKGGNDAFAFRLIFGTGAHKMRSFPLKWQYARETIRKNRLEFAWYSLGKFVGVNNNWFEPSLDWWLGNTSPSKRAFFEFFVLPLTFKSVYLLLMLEMAVLAITLYFTRHVLWFWCVCWLLMTGTIFMAVVGSGAECVRLVFPVLPLVMLLVAKYVDFIVYAIKELRGQKIIQYLKE